MSLSNFVDGVGPVVPAAYFNALDLIRNAIVANAGGVLTIAPVLASGNAGPTALTLAANGQFTLAQLLTLSQGLAVSGGPFTSRGITDNATSTQLVLQPSGGISMGGAADPGAGSLNLANPLQVAGIPTANAQSGTGGLFTFSTAEQYLNSVSLPANSIGAGATFRFTSMGVCTSSAVNTVTFQLRLGPAGTIADTSLWGYAVASTNSGTSIGWSTTFIVTFSTVGAATSGCSNGTLLNNGTTGICGVAVTTGPSTWVATGATNVASKLGISLKTSAATTSLTVYTVSVERVF